MNDNIVRNRLSKEIISLSFDKEELKKLLDILQQRANTASEIEYKILESNNFTNLTQAKAELDICAPIKVTITSSESEELFGTIDEVFNSVSYNFLKKLRLFVLIAISVIILYLNIMQQIPLNYL